MKVLWSWLLELCDLDQVPTVEEGALGLDDWLLEVNAPANRGDLLGHLGVARELVALLRGKLVLPDVDLSLFRDSAASSAYMTGGRPDVELAIAAGEDCPRYVARVI